MRTHGDGTRGLGPPRASRSSGRSGPFYRAHGLRRQQVSAVVVHTQLRLIRTDTLNQAESRLNTARDKVAVAVGQPAGTSIRMSMCELKQRAGGTVKVKLNVPNPIVSLSGGNPEAAGGVRAVNDAVREVDRVVIDLSTLPPQIVALVNACKAFTRLVGAAAKEAGLAPMEIPKLVKTVGGNVEDTADLPKAIGSLVMTAKDMFTGIPEGLADTAPLTDEAMAAKKDAKSAKKTGTSQETPPSAVMEKVTAAITLFADAEVSQALRVLNAAEALALRNPDAVSPDDYQALYESRGLVLLVQGDTPGALKDISRALEADPSPLRLSVTSTPSCTRAFRSPAPFARTATRLAAGQNISPVACEGLHDGPVAIRQGVFGVVHAGDHVGVYSGLVGRSGQVEAMASARTHSLRHFPHAQAHSRIASTTSELPFAGFEAAPSLEPERARDGQAEANAAARGGEFAVPLARPSEPLSGYSWSVCHPETWTCREPTHRRVGTLVTRFFHTCCSVEKANVRTVSKPTRRACARVPQ